MEKMTNSSVTAYRYHIPAGSNFIVYVRRTDSLNTLYYVTKDNIDSTAVVTGQTGGLTVAEKYAALGWNEGGTVSGVTRHEFAGQEGLDNDGLWMVNMNGRIYVPSGSMFISPDPDIPDPTRTADYDRYAYAEYNPLTYNDPTGFDDNKPKDQSGLTSGGTGGSGAGSGPGDGFGPGGNFGEGPDGGMYAAFSGATCFGACGVTYRDTQNLTAAGGSTSVGRVVDVYQGSTQDSSTILGSYEYNKATGLWDWDPSGLTASSSFGSLSINSSSAGAGVGMWSTFGGVSWGGVGAGRGVTASAPTTGAPAPAQQSNPNKLPPCSSITAASVDFTSQIGVQGSGGFHFNLFGLKVGLDLGINLLSYNTPLSGSPYLSHGLDAEMTIGSARFGGSWEQTSYNGGLNYESEPSNFLLYDFSGSSQGLDYQITPPQLFAGFKAGISNVAALLPSGDTPQCHAP